MGKIGVGLWLIAEAPFLSCVAYLLGGGGLDLRLAARSKSHLVLLLQVLEHVRRAVKALSGRVDLGPVVNGHHERRGGNQTILSVKRTM